MSKKSQSSIIESLALCRFSGVTSRLMEALLNRYGNIERILNADAGSLMSISGMSVASANKISSAKHKLDRALEYFNSLKVLNIDVITRFDPNYPQRLFELNDPPSLLYSRGKAIDNDRKVVAISGADRVTNEGIELTVNLAKALSQAGVQIVSSLNKGIDAASYVGSKASGGSSFLVLNNGHEEIVTPEDKAIAIDIIKNGGLISEYPFDQKSKKDSYKESNRIIVGLAQAVIVTEFYEHSVITMDLLKCCAQIGKLVFIMIDPRHGALADKESINKAISYGAIPMVGLDKIPDIIQSLV